MHRSVPALFCQCTYRPSEAELLGISHLDPETEKALFPHLHHKSAASKRSTWKWSDIGSAPVLHALAKQAHAKPLTASATAAGGEAGAAADIHHEAAAAAEDAPAALQQIPKACTGSRNRHHRTAIQCSSHDTSPSRCPEPENYLVALRWGTHSSSSSPEPQPPPQQRPLDHPGSSRIVSPLPFSSSSSHQASALLTGPGRAPFPDPGATAWPLQSSASSHQADGSGPGASHTRLRTVSPSVARACVTLPGFSSPPRALPPRENPAQDGQSPVVIHSSGTFCCYHCFCFCCHNCSDSQHIAMHAAMQVSLAYECIYSAETDTMRKTHPLNDP